MCAQGAFEFNPARHDFGAKTPAGHPLTAARLRGSRRGGRRCWCGRGPARASCPASLRSISSATIRRSRWWSGWRRHSSESDGDIAAVLRTLFSSRELPRRRGANSRIRCRYVVSAMRLAYDDRPDPEHAPGDRLARSTGRAGIRPSDARRLLRCRKPHGQAPDR